MNTRWVSPWVLALLLVSATAILAGCGFTQQAALGVGAKVAESKALDNLASPQKSVMLHGFVERLSGDLDENVLVTASTLQGEVIAAVSIGKQGYYNLFVPPGTYFISGYVDRDEDGTIYPHEVAGQLPSTVTVLEGKEVAYFGVDLELSVDSRSSEDAMRRVMKDPFELEEIPSIEPVESLSSDINGEEIIELGTYKSTVEFFNNVAPLQYLEQLDLTTDRIPVILVHGIADSPQVFGTLVEQLDKSRYLPILFHYPSGARLPAMAGLLHHLMLSGKAVPTFSHGVLVAHSMGGLVARGSLNLVDRSPGASHLDVYGSFVSPYGGVDLVNFGIKTGPVIVPSWIDVASESKYVAELFQPLPEGMTFYMENGNAEGSSDGVIALSSQRRPEALHQAKDTIILPQTHVGIMSDSSALSTMLAWIDGAVGAIDQDSNDEKPAAESRPAPHSDQSDQSDQLPNQEILRRAHQLRAALAREFRDDHHDALFSTITPSILRVRVRHRLASAVLSVSVGHGVRLDAPEVKEPLLVESWPADDEALASLAHRVARRMQDRIEEAPRRQGRPAVPVELRTPENARAPEAQIDGDEGKEKVPPPVVLGTGYALQTTPKPFVLRSALPFRIDGYFGSWGVGGEFWLPIYSGFQEVDDYQFLLNPMVLSAGPRFRFGHADSRFSLALGISGALEMGRGAFYPGDTKRLDSIETEELKSVWVTNALAFGSASAGVKIHHDFYAVLNLAGGIRIPEKTFVIDEQSTVTFLVQPVIDLALGVEVRLP